MDNHVHLSATGQALESSEIRAAQNNAELLAALSRMQTSSVITGHGYDDTKWQADIWDFPYAAYVSRIDVHSGVVSESLAKQVPGLQQVSGWNERGRVTGLAHAKIREFCLSQQDSANYLKIAGDEFLANGVVSVHEMSGPSIAGMENALLVNEFKQTSPLDIHLWWGELAGFETARNLQAYGCGGDLFIDGSIGSMTAAMSFEYPNGSRGNHYVSTEQIVEHVHGAIQHKVGIGFHSIGDAATHSIAQALRQSVALRDQIRLLDFRIEHAEYVSDDDLQTFAEFGVSFSVQPQFDALWGAHDGMYQTRLGSRYRNLNTFARYTKAGIPLLLGSDSPVTSVNPWLSIRAALSMNNSNQSLSSRAAFRAHTSDGYRRIGDHRSHDVSVGSPADLVLWSIEELNVIPAPEFASTWSTDVRSGVATIPNLDDQLPQCLLTIKSGEIVFASHGWRS
jgi:predicted amidohydrolase YtcJ